MEVLEYRVPFGASQTVDALDRGLGVAGSLQGPGVDQRGGQIGDRPAHRLGDMLACSRVLLLLQRLDAEHEARDALRLVDLDDAVGELHQFIDFAIDQKSKECAFEQHRVLRVGAQRGAIIGRG